MGDMLASEMPLMEIQMIANGSYSIKTKVRINNLDCTVGFVAPANKTIGEIEYAVITQINQIQIGSKI